MKLVRNSVIALLLAPLLAWAESEDYQEVSMNQVPERVVKTAKSAKPGIYVTRVIRQQDNDDLIYNFYASQVGRYWVIVVREDGQLLEVYESPSAPPKMVTLKSND